MLRPLVAALSLALLAPAAQASSRTLVLLGTDNDFSVTQTGVGEQFDVCVNRTDGTRAQVALDAPCPSGKALIPGFLMSFAVDFSN